MKIHALVLLALPCLATGCNRRGSEGASPNAAAGPAAVGWALDLPGEPLRRGRVRTEPAGHEDALVPSLATATRLWGQSCRAEVNAATAERQTATATLSLQIGNDGTLGTARAAAPGSPLDTCLVTEARRAAGQTLRPTGEGPPLQVWVALDFSRATP